MIRLEYVGLKSTFEGYSDETEVRVRIPGLDEVHYRRLARELYPDAIGGRRLLKNSEVLNVLVWITREQEQAHEREVAQEARSSLDTPGTPPVAVKPQRASRA